MAHSVCPWWMGYLLLNPLRRLGQRPSRILGPLLAPGMTALDIGCAMGYFSLPMARMVGSEGRVICVDLEPRMLTALQRRAARAGLLDRIEPRLCTGDGLGLDDCSDRIDLALAFAVVHEVPDGAGLFAQLYSVLRPSGIVLLAEPRGHVKRCEFDRSLQQAEAAGFRIGEQPTIARSHTALLHHAVE